MSQEERSIQDLETEEKLAFLEREWLIERLSWGLGASLLTAATLGFLGPGPLTWTKTTDGADSLTVSYYAAERYESDTELRLTIHHPPSETVRVKVDRTFLNLTTPHGIWPPPVKTEPRGDSLICTFDFGTSEDKQEIVYYFTHETYGPVRFNVAIEGGEPVTVSQFVFP